MAEAAKHIDTDVSQKPIGRLQAMLQIVRQLKFTSVNVEKPTYYPEYEKSYVFHHDHPVWNLAATGLRDCFFFQ